MESLSKLGLWSQRSLEFGGGCPPGPDLDGAYPAWLLIGRQIIAVVAEQRRIRRRRQGTDFQRRKHDLESGRGQLEANQGQVENGMGQTDRQRPDGNWRDAGPTRAVASTAIWLLERTSGEGNRRISTRPDTCSHFQFAPDKPLGIGPEKGGAGKRCQEPNTKLVPDNVPDPYIHAEQRLNQDGGVE